MPATSSRRRSRAWPASSRPCADRRATMLSARERFLGIMAEQADRMRRLVDDLLMLSRIEQHEHARPDAAIDLGSVLKGVLDLLQLKASSRKVALELSLAPGAAARDRRLRRAHHRVPEPGRQRAEIRQARDHGARGGAAGRRGTRGRRRQRRGRRHSRPTICRGSPSASTASMPRARASWAAPGSASPSSSTSSTAIAAASTSRARPARARPSR